MLRILFSFHAEAVPGLRVAQQWAKPNPEIEVPVAGNCHLGISEL